MKALVKREAFPVCFTTPRISPISLAIEEYDIAKARDNSRWTVKEDQELMAWLMKNPRDWFDSAVSETFMWGAGRHGQLLEGSVSHNLPKPTISVENANQVSIHYRITRNRNRM